MDVSLFRNLRDADYKKRGLIVAEGRIVAEKVLEADLPIRTMVCVPAAREEWLRRARGRFPVETLPRPEIEALAGFPFHRGVLALAERPAVVALTPDTIPEGPLLFLWNVTDPDNLGTLIRSAAALGARGILLGPGCADPYGRKALRTSMGNSLIRPLRAADIRSLGVLKHSRFRTIAAALSPGAEHPEAFRPSRRTVLVLGNEGSGLPAEVVTACRRVVSVPMARDVDSLNVAAAGAILMYKLFGRRTPLDTA